MTKVWHIVLFRKQPHVGDEAVATVRRLFAGCVGKCDGLEWVRAGSNHSASAFAKGWTEAVVMQFRDRAARDAYLFHPLHHEVSAITRQGFYSELVVFDTDVEEPASRKEQS